VDDCVFCGIARGDQPAEVVHETDSSVAFLPLRPAARGHTLLIPKAHVTDFLSCPPPLTADLAVVAAGLGRAIRGALAADGMNLISSAGEAATQTVFHLHLHLIPRWDDDALGDLWPLRGSDGELDTRDVAQRIRREIELSSQGH
jgi:histidine triad (HIT) family protein